MRPALALGGRSSRHALEGATVLQIIPALDGGGAEQSVIEHAVALAEAGARPLVATRGGRLVGELQARGGVWLPFPADSKSPLSMLLNARRLAALAKAERVDLIHAHSRAPAWVALGAARLIGKPLATSLHGVYGGGSRVKMRYNAVMAKGDVVIANSRFTAGTAAKIWPEAAARLRIVPCGVDLSAFDPKMVDPGRVAALRAGWGVEPHQRMVVMPARMTTLKGHKVLIESAKLLKDRGVEDVVFILAGRADGRERYVRELDSLVAARGLDAVVRQVGHCDDMPAAYLAAAAVAAPSIEPETFGRVAVEAQAMGAAVIAADHGAAPETILSPPEVAAGQRTGWRVAVGDAAAQADALMEVLSLGASARAGLAERARAHVARHFSQADAAAAALDAYAAALGR